MEPPHSASQPTTPPSSAVPPKPNHHPDSIDSSPRSRTTDDDTAVKLRLLCSYGGHIVPRPHDKSLCYVGGDTRIVVAERGSTLADLSARLSKTLLGGRFFTLKYQLPSEDLDSLISVTTDEDLDNMIDEYDRIANSPKSSHLRLFLFPSSPPSSAKSDDWFLSALNGAGLVDRGFSESASVNSLLGLDDGAAANNPNTPPMVETSSSSSFGSSSSSPLLSNLPPIRVHVEDQRLGIEEQFGKLGVSSGQKHDEGFVAALSSPPPMPRTLTAAAMSSEYANRVVSDDARSERSDHGGSVGYRKLPATQQLQAQKPSSGFDLASPDSASSDNSIANGLSRSKPVIYHEQLVQIANANPVVHDPGYVLQHQFDQQQHQQFIHPGAHYVQQHSGAVPVPAYYPVYPPHQLDQQYPVYYMPARQGQAYNVPMQQPNVSEAPSSRPQASPALAMAQQPPSTAYNTRTGGPGAPPAVVQVPSSQHQQYVGYSQMQMQYQSQPAALTTSAPASYGYEYYTQPLAPTISAAQYQTMTGAALPDGSAQHSKDAMKQQQVRSS